MSHQAQVRYFMLLPLAVAGLVALTLAPWPESETASADAAMRQAVYQECQAQASLHAAAAPHGGSAPRTQSPAWLQQRETGLIHCLQARLRGQVLAASR